MPRPKGEASLTKREVIPYEYEAVKQQQSFDSWRYSGTAGEPHLLLDAACSLPREALYLRRGL